MSTLRQIEANRRNAQKSTGPKTSAGKSAASANALKIGIYSTAAVLPFEDAGALAILAAGLHARFSPATPETRFHIDEFIRAEWELRRLRRAEAELTTYIHEDCFHPDDDHTLGQPAAIQPKIFSGLQWRANAIRKARNQALAAIRLPIDTPSPDAHALPPAA
ncbi:MAG: hypothetical protein JWP63_6617 [Candidatus Solibacter sp.]|jgi:hypothetical protein|nr:hypothetical protein [Candidatus Solibacter sp.]